MGGWASGCKGGWSDEHTDEQMDKLVSDGICTDGWTDGRVYRRAGKCVGDKMASEIIDNNGFYPNETRCDFDLVELC